MLMDGVCIPIPSLLLIDSDPLGAEFMTGYWHFNEAILRGRGIMVSGGEGQGGGESGFRVTERTAETHRGE